MFEHILKDIQRATSLDGTIINPKESKEFWSKSVKLYSTREEAMHAHNADSIKKRQPISIPRGLSMNQAANAALDKYVDDLMEKYLNG